jgi:pilus assembly protein CpaB
MNLKTWIPLIVAVVLGLFAAMAAKRMLAIRQADTQEHPKFVEVVVARNNLMAGSVIHEGDLTLGKIDTVMDPGGVFINPADLEGRVVQAPVFKGLPVLASQLAPKGMGGGLQALVPEGMRAITVEVNEFSGVGGFLVPGCHVDVIAAVPNADGELMSRTIVQRVKVTAVGQRMTLTTDESEQREQVRSVTLIASPQEAEAIELAASTSRPRLVLRSGNDQSVGVSEGVTVAELRGRYSSVFTETTAQTAIVRPLDATPLPDPAPPIPARPAERSRSIKIIRGGAESSVNIVIEAADEQMDGQMTAAGATLPTPK